MAQRVIRDAVHNHIYFDKDKDKLVLNLLECKEVQRLRRIRQLGVSNTTYPGAEHSRFSHAIGTAHIMKTALRYLEENGELPVEGEERDLYRQAAIAAALLHDIGHGPFSHLLEEFGGQSHEKATTDIITRNGSEVNAVLVAVDESLPNVIKEIISGQNPDILWLGALMSSQLDVDRTDYLLRDSYYCGVPYGEFDYRWLLHTMRLQPAGPGDDKILQPVWQDKARYVIEEYIFARYYMYKQVYYHKTTCAYEELVRAICQRARDLFDTEATGDCAENLRKFVCGKDLTRDEFQKLDDSVLLSHIVDWQEHNDEILADLCRRFLNRRGFKLISSPYFRGALSLEGHRKIDEVSAYLESKGKPCDYYLRERNTVNKAYKYYHPEREPSEQMARTSILVDAGGDPEEISNVPGMERLRTIAGRSEEERFWFVPEELRDEVNMLLR